MKLDAESIRYFEGSLCKYSYHETIWPQLQYRKIPFEIGYWMFEFYPFLNWIPRVESISILARLINLFRTPPFSIPTKQFMAWDLTMSRHHWIRYKALQSSKERGDTVETAMLWKNQMYCNSYLIIFVCDRMYISGE